MSRFAIRASRPRWSCAASTSVGAISAPCAPPPTAASRATRATADLPEPTSPWRRRDMGRPAEEEMGVEFSSSSSRLSPAVVDDAPPAPTLPPPLDESSMSSRISSRAVRWPSVSSKWRAAAAAAAAAREGTT